MNYNLLIIFLDMESILIITLSVLLVSMCLFLYLLYDLINTNKKLKTYLKNNYEQGQTNTETSTWNRKNS